VWVCGYGFVWVSGHVYHDLHNGERVRVQHSWVFSMKKQKGYKVELQKFRWMYYFVMDGASTGSEALASWMWCAATWMMSLRPRLATLS